MPRKRASATSFSAACYCIDNPIITADLKIMHLFGALGQTSEARKGCMCRMRRLIPDRRTGRTNVDFSVWGRRNPMPRGAGRKPASRPDAKPGNRHILDLPSPLVLLFELMKSSTPTKWSRLRAAQRISRKQPTFFERVKPPTTLSPAERATFDGCGTGTG